MSLNLFNILGLVLVCFSYFVGGNVLSSENILPQEIVSHYSTKNDRVIENPEIYKITSIYKDINGDSYNDYFVYDVGYCGSSGCTGFIYLFDANCKNKKNKYCFIGKEMKNEVMKKIFLNLKCGKDYDYLDSEN